MKTSIKKSKTRDPNQRAAAIVAAATEEDTKDEDPADEEDGKNPHAVALGKLGGKKGGDTRAARLSPERRREIAQKAARARWGEKE